MSLFRRKKNGDEKKAEKKSGEGRFSRVKKIDENEVFVGIDPMEDQGMVGMYFRAMAQIEGDFAKAVRVHLENLHEPDGYAREKQAHDFMELGMKREYLDALDDIEFTIEEIVSAPVTALRRRGMATLVTRFQVRGVHSRPLAGFPPSGQPVTLEGITYTTFRNYNVRVEYTYWHIPEVTRSMVER